MAQLIKAPEMKVVTQQGEVRVSITLELNINLNDGGLSVRATAKEEPVQEAKEEWVLPEFTTAKVKFGKYIEEK